METVKYAALALLVATGLAACSSSPKVPATAAQALPAAPDDQVARGVGNLRRLAVLPVVIDQDSCAWPEVAHDLDESSIRFLRDWKGYELVRPAQLDPSWRLARRLGEWQEKNAGNGKPANDLQAQIVAIARDSGADGILVIHASPECTGGTDAGLLSLPARLAESLNRTLSAGIYEAGHGAPVWYRQVQPQGWDPTRYASRPPPRFETRQAAETLFGPLENAVPAVLKPATPPPATVVTPATEATPLVPVPTTPVPEGGAPVPTTPATGGAEGPAVLPAAPTATAPAAEPSSATGGSVPQLPAPESPAVRGAPEATPPPATAQPAAAPIRI